jgi:plastocyanin
MQSLDDQPFRFGAENEMRKGRSSFVAAAMALSCLLASCTHQADTSATSDDDQAAPNSAGRPVETATAGSVMGVVKFEGVAHKMKVINMAAVPKCVKMHPSPAVTEDVVPGENGTLQNVVVYLKGDFRQYSFDVAKPVITMDQNGCVYHPHVFALMTGQHLRVTNSDQTTHNVNAGPKINRRWNESQSAGASPIDEVFERTEIGIPIKCNVHPWMKAYFAVFSNPYFQVTGEDGSFKISNVPPGTYKLTAWHELYGTREQTLTIRPREERTATITFTDRDRH